MLTEVGVLHIHSFEHIILHYIKTVTTLLLLF